VWTRPSTRLIKGLSIFETQYVSSAFPTPWETWEHNVLLYYLSFSAYLYDIVSLTAAAAAAASIDEDDMALRLYKSASSVPH